MNGKKPNSPLIGCHDDEKRSSPNDCCCRIGPDLINKPIVINTMSNAENRVAANISLLDKKSLNILRRIVPDRLFI
jgi:hypothetical protein